MQVTAGPLGTSVVSLAAHATRHCMYKHGTSSQHEPLANSACLCIVGLPMPTRSSEFCQNAENSLQTQRNLQSERPIMADSRLKPEPNSHSFRDLPRHKVLRFAFLTGTFGRNARG